MERRTYSNQVRRPKVHVSPYIANYITERNPWAVVWWSAAFPGAGHFLLCKYASGGMLMIWEFFVNTKGHVNEAIVYSMLGKFDTAKAVIDTRWFLIYTGVYIFQIWDCYKLTVDLNKYSQLADRADSPIMPFNIGALETHYLDTRNPWFSAFWGFINPGLEAVYANRLPMGFFGLGIFIPMIYYSNVLPAILLTFEGKAAMAGSVINPQWFLDFPSIMCFAAAAGYLDTFNTNQLFKIEQSRYLTDNFQPKGFDMPKNRKKVDTLHFISSFQHSAYLELALSDLEQEGIPKDNIFVAPLGKRSSNVTNMKKAHQEGASQYELAFIFGTVCMLLGEIYGFILAWGPIIWGLIGLAIGAILGIVTSMIVQKAAWKKKFTKTEVVLIVECDMNQSKDVERLLWQHKALGVMKTS